MGRFALDLQHHGVDAIGGGGYRVAIRRFVGENVIMLAGEFGDQCLRARRAHLLVRIEEHSDRAVVVELLVAQQLERMQDHRHAALGIGDTRPVGALPVHAERAFGGAAFGEHGVVVDHQQEVLAALALQGGDDIVPYRGRGRSGAHLGSQCLQALDQHLADRGQPLFLAGAGIHGYQLLDGFEIGRLFGFRLFQQFGGFDFGSHGGHRRQAECDCDGKRGDGADVHREDLGSRGCLSSEPRRWHNVQRFTSPGEC